ncbi:MAG: hypothetical protein IJZ53_14270 [Tyzzerella sp.]|nr:hypothetical protein [Tyzzerella sp.]
MQKNEKSRNTISLEEYLRIQKVKNKNRKRRTYLYINRGLIIENTNVKY